MNNCIFCQIADKKMKADIIFEDNDVVAFSDINPKAPIHILVIPKKHIDNIDEAKTEDQELLGHMILVAQKIARDKNISENGYRLTFNVKKHAGQIVDHIHLHILGGKSLGSMV